MKLVDTISSVLRQKGRDVYHVTPTHSVYDAIEMMADKHVGALLVIADGRLVGDHQQGAHVLVQIGRAHV